MLITAGFITHGNPKNKMVFKQIINYEKQKIYFIIMSFRKVAKNSESTGSVRVRGRIKKDKDTVGKVSDFFTSAFTIREETPTQTCSFLVVKVSYSQRLRY